MEPRKSPAVFDAVLDSVAVLLSHEAAAEPHRAAADWEGVIRLLRTLRERLTDVGRQQ